MEYTIIEKKGLKFETYVSGIDKSKIKEVAVAIGDLREGYFNGTMVPPTFPTLIEFRGGEFLIPDFLGVDNDKLLHGEQEYEYLGKMSVGDLITVSGEIEDAYMKSGMKFYLIKREFTNQDNELVLRSRTTIIETR